jgi:tetratricopeptide (TPR) repeat protein
MRVILKDDGYAQVATARTDAAGRFRFGRLVSGNYYVEVEPDATNYERKTERVEIRPFNARRGSPSGEVFRIELILKVKSPPRDARFENKVVFYQPVPETAKKEYTTALKALEKNSFDDASSSLKRAIELFPDYYDALELLGTELVRRKQYNEAVPLLSHAAEINKSGWRAFYSLGIAQAELNQRFDSLQALKRAAELNPNSANVHMRLGMELAKAEETRADAIASLKRVSQIAGNSIPQVYWYLGALYNKAGQWREAADAFESFLKADPQAGERDKIKQIIKQLREKASKS